MIQVSKGRIPPEELRGVKELVAKFEVENIRVEVWIYHGSGKGVEALEW